MASQSKRSVYANAHYFHGLVMASVVRVDQSLHLHYFYPMANIPLGAAKVATADLFRHEQ